MCNAGRLVRSLELRCAFTSTFETEVLVLSKLEAVTVVRSMESKFPSLRTSCNYLHP